MKITEGVYAYIWKSMFENNCNMYYFGDPLNILFDIGLKNYTDVRFENMKEDGLDIKKIQYIVNTHSHPDHCEGCFPFMGKDIPVAMYKDEIDFINELGPGFFQMMGLEMPKLEFKIILNEGKWQVGDTELEVIHTPGHSPGSISIYWPEKKTLVCGDLIFERSVGRTDFPGGDGDLLKNSIQKLSKLDIEILLPGHMNFIKGRDAVKENFDFIITQYFPFI